MNIAADFENGKIVTYLTVTDSQEIDFCPHAKFKGVSLKHLVKGEMTNNQISCHLVKVEPFCTLETHIHENNLEIHEVIYGGGVCEIAENKVDYTVGSIGVIPASTTHKVVAGENGIYILAKFTPALL